MARDTIYPRFVEPRLAEALADSPAVLIHGPRQSGKTTLARRFGEGRGYAYINLDDDTLRDAAEADPVGFAADLSERVILDEVQRTPSLFRALKTEIDRRRTPGRFLMAGSTQVLLLPRLSDSLAGRLQIVRLHPLSQAELTGRIPDFLGTVFRRRLSDGPQRATWTATGRADRRRGISGRARPADGATPSPLAPRLHSGARGA